MDYTELFKTLITSTIFIGSLTWLVKEIIRMFLSKQVDLYKNELKQEFLTFETKMNYPDDKHTGYQRSNLVC